MSQWQFTFTLTDGSKYSGPGAENYKSDVSSCVHRIMEDVADHCRLQIAASDLTRDSIELSVNASSTEKT